MTEEAEKTRRIRSAAQMLASDPGAGIEVGRFAETLFSQGAAEDLLALAPTDLARIAREAWAHLVRHRPGTHDISIETVTLDGAHGPRSVTIIEIVNDNMPFLVDSVMGELQEAGCEIHLVLHPIPIVERDSEGRFLRLADSGQKEGTGSRKLRESLIHIHIDPLADAREGERLAAQLSSVLGEVRTVVSDWKAMLKRLHDTIETYEVNPPPLPVDEIAEAVAFLRWLADDNFTFLGMREYVFEGAGGDGELIRSKESGLGILTDPEVRVLRRGTELVTMTPEIREFLAEPQPLIITKANVRSRVHRRIHMDYVGVKLYAEGALSGELRIVGLFTSTAYTRSARSIPYIRRKIDLVLKHAGHDPESHSGKALLNVLETYPRDELFQLDTETLQRFAMAILQLEERPRVRVLARRDRFDRFVSVLVFVPRDRYSTEVRIRIGDYLKSVYDGRLSAWYVAYAEASLTRLHYIIGRYEGETPNPAQGELEAAVNRLVRTWGDRLRFALQERFDPIRARLLLERYRSAFTLAYQDTFEPESAIADIVVIEGLSAEQPIAIDFHALTGEEPCRVGLRLMRMDHPLPLSERVPMLENMGFRVIDERTYRIMPGGEMGGQEVWLHDMTLERRGGRAVALESLGGRLEAVLMAVLTGQAESDGYDALALEAGLDWREVSLVRALSRYLRQARIPFSQDYMWATLVNHPDIVRHIVALFAARLDPDFAEGDREAAAARILAEAERLLDTVASLDEDRILRRFLNLVGAILRTNFYQRDANGRPPQVIAFKLDSKAIDGLPDPRPFREIFVYGARVEGVHLRFGRVARGGIRWSDRPQDFRTEVLGLVKAQRVKNAVIVPVGAKGGFIPKRLPAGGGREAIFAEGAEAYRRFVSTLLDLTDNVEDGVISPPPETVRHDGDDPYLVVAADKGTATFSDLANAISQEHGYWLDDAFASGGSAGYDHKKMGITARGAWEAVKRHFRELGIDIQTTPFTVVGIGDMSGDVFGNGMLLSPQIRLIAAFDHRDIFIDPDPDPATSLAERRRLFELPRSSWQDYDPACLSRGGGIYSRSLKVIELSSEARAALGLDRARLTPQELMTAILKAPADLLWFGGIGTYVRAPDETDDQVGDRANDAIRITSADLNVKVVGEGANLGMTQRARIAFAQRGGRLNTDAIDNSGGVNSSDLEVNIKIALRSAERAGRLARAERNALLAAMTDEVAGLVLRNNYLQTLALSLAEKRGMEDFGFAVRLIRELEARGVLDRAVETLPDDMALAEREKAGPPFTRPELAVLLAYAKIDLYDALLETGVPDDAYLGRELFRYFPQPMQESYAAEIEAHPLRREIIATMLSNSMINRGGPTLLPRIADRTGAGVADIAAAFAAARDAFEMTELNAAIDALDAKVPGSVQLDLYAAVQHLLHQAMVWFLRNADLGSGLAPIIGRYREGIRALAGSVDRYLPEDLATHVERECEVYRAQGVPEDLARRIAHLPLLADAPDVVLVSERTGASADAAAAAYFAVTGAFSIARLMALADGIDARDYYDALALDRARDLLAEGRRRLTAAALAEAGGLDALIERRKADVERTRASIAQITEGTFTVSRFAVAAGLLTDLAG